jgi:hypothetical protein
MEEYRQVTGRNLVTVAAEYLECVVREMCNCDRLHDRRNVGQAEDKYSGGCILRHWAIVSCGISGPPDEEVG